MARGAAREPVEPGAERGRLAAPFELRRVRPSEPEPGDGHAALRRSRLAAEGKERAAARGGIRTALPRAVTRARAHGVRPRRARPDLGSPRALSRIRSGPGLDCRREQPFGPEL